MMEFERKHKKDITEDIMEVKNFITDMLSSDKPISAKRTFGGLGFICCLVFIPVFRQDLVESLLYVSASLLGLETLTNIFKR